MEHKGFQFQVGQTANPSGYNWTVDLANDRIRSGHASSRGTAIFHAVRVIDKAVSASAKVMHGSRIVAEAMTRRRPRALQIGPQSI